MTIDQLDVKGDVTCNRVLPRKPFQLAHAGCRLWAGTGAPPSTLGSSSDFYFRLDGGGAGATHLYVNNAGTWLGIA